MSASPAVGPRRRPPAGGLGLRPDPLVHRIVSVVGSPRFRPPVVAAVAMEMRRLATRGSAAQKELFDLVGTPLLTGRLLSMARQRPDLDIHGVRTLHAPVSEMGPGPMNRVVADVLEGGLVSRAPRYARGLGSVNKHSVATAWVAHLLARYTGADRALWRVAGAVGIKPETIRHASEQAHALLQRLF